MGFMDKIKQAAKGRSATIEKGIDMAVTQVNKRTGGKYDDKLTKQAKDLKNRARQLDDERPPTDPPSHPPTDPPGTDERPPPPPA